MMMVDNPDLEKSTLHLLLFQALKQYSTSALLPMLGGKDAIVRVAAARELQTRGGDDVFEVAASFVKSSRHESREIAAFLLGQLGTPKLPYRGQSLPLLTALLKDDYYEVRSAAAAALGHLHAEEALGELIMLASDAEPEVRECVAFALGLIKANKQSIDVLRRLSEEQNKDVREWAEFALEQHVKD